MRRTPLAGLTPMANNRSIVLVPKSKFQLRDGSTPEIWSFEAKIAAMLLVESGPTPSEWTKEYTVQ